MNHKLLAYILAIATIPILGNAVCAQRNVTPAIDRDPIMEQDARHNLDVAAQYFKLKKAYKAVLMRFEETFAAYPEFSKMDEFLYYAGMSSLYLSQNKGKQKASDNKMSQYAPEKLRENAVAYLALIVDKYPQSQYKDEAEKTIKLLKTEK